MMLAHGLLEDAHDLLGRAWRSLGHDDCSDCTQGLLEMGYEAFSVQEKGSAVHGWGLSNGGYEMDAAFFTHQVRRLTNWFHDKVTSLRSLC